MDKITEIKIISSLEKIYDEDKIPFPSFKDFSMLINEKKSFQIAVEAKEDCKAEFKIDTDLKTEISTVKHIKSDLPMTDEDADDYYRFSKSGYYPDLLIPLENSNLNLKKGVNVFWVEIDSDNSAVGKHTVKVSVDDRELELSAEVINAELDFSDFVYTSWFHTDCLMSYYGFDAFSDEYWRVTENFLKTARQYGMNCVLTPIFTPALDTEVGKERPTVQLIDVELTNGVYSF